MRITIYVEGGGDSSFLRSTCRKGFASFFQNAGLAGRMPKVVACGSRRNAYDRFASALRSPGPGQFIVLLVDSEGRVPEAAGLWTHLGDRDGWNRPADVTEEQVQLMVQCMESWFLADSEALAAYFGRGFQRKALPGNPNIEELPREEVLQALRDATRRCESKGRYDKGRHSFALLGRVDPDRVARVSPHARRLLETVRGRAS